ncbi:MAG: hypothetical protein ACXW11_05495 [Methylotenera sp.]
MLRTIPSWHTCTNRRGTHALTLYGLYVLDLEDYLLQTWHPDTRPATLDLGLELTGKVQTPDQVARTANKTVCRPIEKQRNC